MKNTYGREEADTEVMKYVEADIIKVPWVTHRRLLSRNATKDVSTRGHIWFAIVLNRSCEMVSKVKRYSKNNRVKEISVQYETK